MSFADTFKKTVAPHVDTPAQAEARANAVAKIQSDADAKTARAAAQRAGKKEGAPKGAEPDKKVAPPHP
jgi:hypothetical protein